MRTLLAALLALACLAPPAHGLARNQIFGIGDIKHPRAFESPWFKRLKPGSVRYIADWNIARTKGPDRARLDAWYNAALDAGIDPLVTFHGRHAPSIPQYTRAFGAALRRWPGIREWQAWNEANHVSEPVTYRYPARAAKYAKAMERRCPRCTVIPLTYVLSNKASSDAWMARFLAAYGRDPDVWAVHAYGDANRFQFNLLKRFLRLHPTGKVWITETAGLAKFRGNLRFDLQRQKRATKWAFDEALAFRDRVDRMYYWQWRGAEKPRRVPWDSGLLDAAGNPRPAYKVALKERFRRR